MIISLNDNRKNLYFCSAKKISYFWNKNSEKSNKLFPTVNG